MAKEASLFSSLDTSTKNKIYVVDNFALDITSHGDATWLHGWIIDVYHVPSLSVNLLSISQLTHTGKIVEFWLDHFFVKYMNKYGLIVVEGILNSKDRMYKFHDLS